MKVVAKLLWLFGGFALLLGLILILHKQIFSAYANFFHLHTAQKGADALICLSGNRETRNPETLRLWHQGYAPLLFVTEEKPKNKRFAGIELSHLDFANEIANRMKLQAEWKRLPSTTGGATSTFDEAQDSLAMAKKMQWKRIIIVTDEFHTRRALLGFERVFQDSGIEVQVAGAANEIFDSGNWWKSDLGILAYLNEAIKYPVYLIWRQEPTLVRND